MRLWGYYTVAVRGVSILLWLELRWRLEMHPQAKSALANRILRLVSNILSEEDRATEYEEVYAQLLRNQLWKRKFSKRFLNNEVEKLLEQLQGVKDAEAVSEQIDRFIANLEAIPRENFQIEVEEHDYTDLDSFPQKWRWTDVQWNLLPPDVLTNIRPLSRRKALEVNEQARLFHPDEGFVPGSFDLVAQLDIVGMHYDAQQVREWLRQYLPAREERLIVSWDYENAVVTTVAILCEYWDDFCYPGSDDVVVSPFSDEWMLFYWHEEVFFFGQRCET